MKTVQSGLSGDIETVKADRQTLKDRVSAHSTYMTGLKQDINRIKSKIVDNPERLFQIVKELTQSIAAEKAALAALDKKSRDLQSRIETISGIEQDLGKSVKMMEDVEGEIRRIEESNARIGVEREKIAQRQTHLKDLNAEDQHIIQTTCIHPG